MITLIPINKNIQKTLHEKIGMLGKQDLPNPNEPQTDEKGVAPENYMFTRVPFLRAVSFTQKKKTENKVVILSGGKLSKWGRLRAGFSDRNVDVNDTISSDKKLNEFGLYTAPNSDIVDDIPYRPIAGVKDINIDYKGGGMMLGATRTAQMSWTCWTWEELNELTPHFLTPGRTVLLEWGWSGLGKLQDTQLLPIIKADSSEIDTKQLANLQQTILQHIIDQKGHYDAMLGLVQTFDWTVRDDGGFDCSTTFVAPGVTMLQKFVKNLNSKAYSQLPGLVTQTQVKKEPWLWFNTKEKWEWKQGGPSSDDIAGLVPYITFKEYMANFTTQVKEFVKQKGYGAWTGSPKSRFQVMTLGLIKHGNTLHLPFQTTTYINREDKKAYKDTIKHWHGGGYFVTWGWFEDNVLSRFFGNVKESGEQKEVLGEFRSFEQDIDDETGEFKVTSDGDPIYRATRMYNSRYLITVDSAQWVIPNKNDPVMRSVDAFGPIDALGELKKKEPVTPEEIAEFKKLIEENKYESGEVNMSQWNNWEFRRACRMKADEEGLAMRDVYFNAGYLQEKLKNVDDLMQGIMTIWEEFSSTYGGIYSFHVDFDDNGNRLILRERGYAGKRAFNLLSKERSKRESPDNLFEFPIWEKGSIVKSNSLNGKLPDRMKMAAMYGANSIKSKEEDDDGVQGTYDDLAGKAWGNLQAPKSKDGATEEEIMEDRYDDLMSGRIDTPSRDNRFFGQIRADMDKELTVGGVEERIITGTGLYDTTVEIIPREPLPDSGMQIYPGIEIAIEASAKAEMLNRARQLSGKEFNETDKDGNPTAGALTNATKIANTSKAMAEEFKKYNAVDGAPSPGKGRVPPVSMKFYEMRLIDDAQQKDIAKGADATRPALKNEYKFAMQKLLRGDDDGVMKQVDPLIPIEFEMEIDGTGGLFPGNSFHSTYLPKRYREEALLQMTKVNHKVSSDGWWVTIKGQMRAVSNFAEKMALEPSPAEKLKKEQMLARIEAEKKIEDQKKKAAQSELKVATTIEFLDISFTKKTAADITQNVPGLDEGTEKYNKANPIFKKTQANVDNKKRDFLEKGRSVRTLEYLQDQFKSGNVDWAQDASIVTQLQQTIKDFGYPNLPSWWGDGDFGPGTQRILGDFLNGQAGSEYMNDSNQYAYIISGFDVLGD
jgi:hypothetical protein